MHMLRVAAVRSSYSDGNAINYCEIWTCDFRDVQADRQTDRQINRQTDTDRNTPHVSTPSGVFAFSILVIHQRTFGGVKEARFLSMQKFCFFPAHC